MPNNSSVPPFTASLEALSQLIPNPKSVTISATDPASDITRIADALERIAAALEKLTSEKAEPIPVSTSNPEPKPKPTPVKNHAPAAKPATQAQPKPALQTSSNGTKPPTQPSASVKTSVLRKHLDERGITTIYEPKKKVDVQKQDALEQLAKHLGQNYVACKELYEQLKANMTDRQSSFNYCLKGEPDKQHKIIQKFCHLLREANILEELIYERKPKYNYTLKVSGKEQHFLSGKWLESYVKQEVARIVQQNTNKLYEPLPNLKIKFQDNTETELDLFFAIGKKVFCIETKMQLNDARVEKWLERIKPLGLTGSKSILVVVANKSEENCQEPVKDWGNVQFTGLDNLEQTVISMLKEAS